MVEKPIVMSAITPVAVAAILILGTLTTISSTSQAFVYISYHKSHYHKGNHGRHYYTTYRHTSHVIIVTSNTGDNTANPPYENPPYENPP